MPGFVRTPKDEEKWARAKKAVEQSRKKNEKNFQDNDWALTNKIFHDMKKSESLDIVKDILIKAKKNTAVEMSPERLAKLKEISKHWLDHADQIKKLNADAKVNPHLFAEGHRIAAHNAAHKDFNEAYHEFSNSDDYRKLSPTQKMRAEIKFKKDWQTRNPGYISGAVHDVALAHQMHDKAQDLHEREMQARKAHILTSDQQESGNSVRTAQQHLGDEGGEDERPAANIQRDPAATFASKYGKHLQNEEVPKVIAPNEYDSLDLPEMNVSKHPALNDPENKKMLNEFFQEHLPTIRAAVGAAKNKAITNGVPEDKIDTGSLHEAGMHGLMQAIHDYQPNIGASFKTYANSKMQGLMQSNIAGQDYVPREMRAKAAAIDKGIIKPAEPKVEQIPAPVVPTANDVIANSGHPDATNIADRLEQVKAKKPIIIRRKEQ